VYCLGEWAAVYEVSKELAVMNWIATHPDGFVIWPVFLLLVRFVLYPLLRDIAKGGCMPDPPDFP
jgi:hypothetical protein